MKKLQILAVSFAAIALAACGGKQNAQTTEEQASEKAFEQQQIEASLKMNFDSLAVEVSHLKQLPIVEKDGAIVLTEDEMKVKPDYLLEPAIAEEAVMLAEKYRIITALEVDRQVAELYGMDVEGYDKAIAKLAADISDPSFKVLDENAANLYETSAALYDAMNENERINFYWQIVATSLVEQLYIIGQNADKFLASCDDETASNLSLRIILIQDAISRLTEYDPELVPVAEALEPLYVINATTVDELKTQLAEAETNIAAARASLVE